MPEMSASARGFCTSRPYRIIARSVILPWALQGARPSGEVLEIGAGSGAMAAGLLGRFPQSTIVATDYDPDMVAAARRALSRWSGRATAERADPTSLPFEDGRFGLVLSCAMLHHVIHWERALSEVSRVLRPGGRLVGFDLMRVAGHRHGGGEGTPGRVPDHDHEPGGRRMVDPVAFERELRDLPFSDVRVRPSTGRLAFRFAATRSA